jgi:hypothetical protein
MDKSLSVFERPLRGVKKTIVPFAMRHPRRMEIQFVFGKGLVSDLFKDHAARTLPDKNWQKRMISLWSQL